MIDPAISLLAALCGALLFAAAALHKLRAPRDFVAALAEYRILPAAAVPFFALALGLTEALVCLAFLWPASRPEAAALGVGLLLVYAFAMVVNLARGRRELDCGCGTSRRTISGWMVARNAVAAAVLALPFLSESDRAITALDYATVAGGLVVCALLYASAELLLPRPALRNLTALESS